MSTRWSLVVSDATDRSLRSYLARTGGREGDLSRPIVPLRRRISSERARGRIAARSRGVGRRSLKHAAGRSSSYGGRSQLSSRSRSSCSLSAHPA